MLLIIFVKPYPELIGIRISHRKSENIKAIDIPPPISKPLGFFKAWTLPG